MVLYLLFVTYRSFILFIYNTLVLYLLFFSYPLPFIHCISTKSDSGRVAFCWFGVDPLYSKRIYKIRCNDRFIVISYKIIIQKIYICVNNLYFLHSPNIPKKRTAVTNSSFSMYIYKVLNEIRIFNFNHANRRLVIAVCTFIIVV